MRLNNQTINIKNTNYNFTTKAENTHNNYNIKCKELYQCYSSYSQAKINAFDYCMGILSHLQESKKINILSYGIGGKNIFQFTYVINAEFKGHLITFYITRDNNKIIADKTTIKLLLETLECVIVLNHDYKFILD